jgi:hypothetical protein
LLKTRLEAESDQMISLGLSEGTLRLPSGVKARLDANEQALATIATSRNLTEKQRDEAISQIRERNTALRRLAQPIPQEERAQSLEAEKSRRLGELPEELRGLPWQLDPKTRALQLPRGYKPPEPQPVMPANLAEDLQGRTVTDEKGLRYLATPGKAGMTYKPIQEPEGMKPKTPEQRLSSAEKVRKAVESRLDAEMKTYEDQLLATTPGMDEKAVAERIQVHRETVEPSIRAEVIFEMQSREPQAQGQGGEKSQPGGVTSPDGKWRWNGTAWEPNTR